MIRSPFRKPLADRTSRYVVVGAACAILNYLIMLVVDAYGGHYALGSVMAYVAITPFGYVLHSRFTFAAPLRWYSFTRFAGGVAASYPIALALLALFCSGFGLSVAIATPLATAGVFLWNFAAAHWAILTHFNLRSVLGTPSPARGE